MLHTAQPLTEIIQQAENFLHSLPHDQKISISGVIACLISLLNDSIQREWSKSFLKTTTCEYLSLPESQYNALSPICSQGVGNPSFFNESNSSLVKIEKDPSPFLENLRSHDLRRRILEATLILTVNRGRYDSRTRVLFRYMARSFDINWRCVTSSESILSACLLYEDSSIELKPKDKEAPRDWKRKVKIGAAAVAGATIFALTGGLAAPALAIGFTALGGAGAAVGGVLATAGGAAAASALFGAAGAGLVGFKADRRFSSVKQFSFDLISSGDGMNVYICISGWVEKVEGDEQGPDFRRPWGGSREYLRQFYLYHNPEKVKEVDALIIRYRGKEEELFLQLEKLYQNKKEEVNNKKMDIKENKVIEEDLKVEEIKKVEDETSSSPVFSGWLWKELIPTGDQYCLQWEDDVLYRLGCSMRSYIKKEVFNFTGKKVVEATVFGALLAAVALPSVALQACNAIDGDWVLAIDRADKAGKLLAHVLLAKQQGYRPVSLIGFSFGSRLIFSCLKELASKGEEGRGIIENAVLLGSPVTAKNSEWDEMNKVVAGRLINGYSLNDWALGIMYRYQGMALSVAGLCPIDSNQVENVDLSHIISGHLEYRSHIKPILSLLQLE